MIFCIPCSYQVGSQISIKTVEFGSPFIENTTEPGYLLLHDGVHHISKNWTILKEPIGEWGGNNFTAEGILEHLNVTKDTSDYLWYIMRYSAVKLFHILS